MKTTAKITAMLLVLALVGSTSARVITVEVTGVVDGVGTHGGLALDGSVVIGSIMTGSTTYDTDTPDLRPDEYDGKYAMISISMTVGNYTFTHDPMSSTSAFFEVHILSSNSYSYWVRSHDTRFDGALYIDGLPKTFDEVNFDPFSLDLMKLVDPDSIITDELPDLDSWPDFSTFTKERSFGVGVDSPPDEPGFAIWGEVTSLTVIPELAMTYYVNAAEGSDENDGLSKETAFATIQKAIDSAFDGDTVLVADGTYTGPGNRDIDFLGKAITVRSESGPENCIIDCNGTWEDPHRGFYFHSNEDVNSILSGFTITNGNAWIGGAIFCDLSSPTITNCTITSNTAADGGGISSWESSPTIVNCTISSNMAGEGGGGGIRCRFNSSPIISNCTITNNTTEGGWGGGGICSSGWGSNNPVITNCTITGNSANDGGGICCWYGSPIITNCTISGNSADYGGGMFYGADSPTITNCTITQNSAAVDGGGISCYFGSDLIITNCILWDNTATRGNEILALYTEYHGTAYPSTVTVNYSDVKGGFSEAYVESGCTLNWGEGNIDADPCFVEPGYWDANYIWIDGDYYLLPDSLCVDAGDPDYVPEPNETDLDGNPRVIGGRIDMGAYETNYIQAAMKLTPQMLNCNSKGKYIKAHFVLPEGFLPEDVDVNEPAMAEPMGIESNYINVFTNEEGFVEIEIAFDRAAFCTAGIDYGPVEVTVTSLLSNCQYFYGTDTIRIINNKLRNLAVFASHWLEEGCGKPDWCGGADVDRNSVVDFVDYVLFDGSLIKAIKK